MSYLCSSRNKNIVVDSKRAIVEGLSEDGGLYTFKKLNKLDINQLQKLDYLSLATKIIANCFDDIDEEIIKDCVYRAYEKSFDNKEVTPLVKLKDDYVLELWHGPTCAFKDVALQLLPHLLKSSYRLLNEEKKICILTATSGDTGKAALEGFKDVEDVYIKVLYPDNLVSLTQERQMSTTKGNNVEVLSVKGNFDDCQRLVKEMMENPLEMDNVKLSSANSINIGRLVPQIVYYFKAYSDLVNNKEIEMGQKVDFVVPTGNFGDVLAGYLGKMMGLPAGKFVVASNENNVLTHFLKTGKYDRKRQFVNTIAPSIDILVSSNLERLLFVMSNDDKQVSSYMSSLNKEGSYQVSEQLLNKIQNDFVGYWVNQDEVKNIIKEVYDNEGYLLDPHSAVGYGALLKYKKENNTNKCVLLSTASPFKFSKDVYNAITGITLEDGLDNMDKLAQVTGLKIPASLAKLKDLEVRFKEVIEVSKAKDIIWKKIGELNHD